MSLDVFGGVHILYLVITLSLSAVGLFLAKRYAKTEKSQTIILKSLAVLLFVWIITNRLSQVFRYEETRWHLIIPDSFCGMTSLVLSLSVLLGKKDNPAYHFVWALGAVGGLVTIFYPTFLDQGPTVFYLPTISGLLHHSITLVVITALFLFKQIHLTYKKWYYTLFGFTAYLTVGAFQMAVFNMSDAFHIVKPMLSGTNLTVWVIAPIYMSCYGLILFGIELVRRRKAKKQSN